MADRTWEDSVEPAMEAAEWVLERLFDMFQGLIDNELEEHGEFEIAAGEVRELINQLIGVNNDCFNRRGASGEDEDIAKVNVNEIMKKVGLKDVGGVHYNEGAYTGTQADSFSSQQHDIGDYLDGKESWEDVLLRVNDQMMGFVVKEKEPAPFRIRGREYTFLYYNPHLNLMSKQLLLYEGRRDVEGRALSLEIEWFGLQESPMPGLVTIRALSGEIGVVASVSCTHFSQVIKILEALPAVIDRKTIQDLLYEAKK